MAEFVCGAQDPSPIPSPFDWPVLAAVGTSASIIAAAYGIAAAMITSLFGAYVATAGAAGAGAIFALVLYYALKPDGCIRPLPKQQPICLSGIVEDTANLSDTTVAVLAPFAMGPAAMFNLVVKTIYLNYVTQSAFWVFCNSRGAAMLPCLVKSKTACGAKIGSLTGAAVGAVAGTILGYIAGAAVGGALGCTASGPFWLLCLLVVLIVAAIVGAAVAYAGALVGGWIGEGIASAGSDPVGENWKGLEPGAVATVKGNWVTNPDIGNNELFYTTEINRTARFSTGPSYTQSDADSTAPDDCPIAPEIR